MGKLYTVAEIWDCGKCEKYNKNCDSVCPTQVIELSNIVRSDVEVVVENDGDQFCITTSLDNIFTSEEAADVAKANGARPKSFSML